MPKYKTDQELHSQFDEPQSTTLRRPTSRSNKTEQILPREDSPVRGHDLSYQQTRLGRDKNREEFQPLAANKKNSRSGRQYGTNDRTKLDLAQPSGPSSSRK
jgi:hypothetical protein